MRVVLDFFDDNVQNSCPDPHVSLQKCNEVLAVVWKDPYAVLKAHKTELLHGHSQAVTNDPAPFWNVKNDHTPTAVPFSLPIPQFYLLLFKRKNFPASVCDAGISFSVSLFEYDKAIYRQFSEYCSGLIAQAGAFQGRQVQKRSESLRSDGTDQECSRTESGQKCQLYITLPPLLACLDSGFFFYGPHIQNIRRSALMLDTLPSRFIKDKQVDILRRLCEASPGHIRNAEPYRKEDS